MSKNQAIRLAKSRRFQARRQETSGSAPEPPIDRGATSLKLVAPKINGPELEDRK
jgi:hypothetical protein